MADCELTPAQVRAELLELTRLGGLELREEVFDVLLDLTRLDVVPTAVSQARLRKSVLKSLCNKSRGAAAPGVGGTTFKGAAGAVLAAAALRAAAATPAAAAAAAPPAPL